MALDNSQHFFESLASTKEILALHGRPEDLYFEAKRCKTPPSDDDKDHLAEALSGFANGDGGVVIYGLVASGGDRQKADVVSKIDPVSPLSKFQGELLSLVGQLVEPPVEGVQVVARAMERVQDTGFLLVHVPRSDNFLHRSRRDREFYRRHGHSFIKMEHYEIAEFYGRRKNPALSFWWDVKVPMWEGGRPNRVLHGEIVVGAHNSGRAIAKHPAILLRGVEPGDYGLDGSGRPALPRQPIAGDKEYLFAGGAAVVYPGTNLQIASLREGRIHVAEQNPHVPDIQGECELFAEDMGTVKTSFQIKGSEVLLKLREKGLLS